MEMADWKVVLEAGFYSNGGQGAGGSYDTLAFGYGFRQGGQGSAGSMYTPIPGGFGGGRKW